MTDIDARLREDVHLLGELLGNTIREQYGDEFLDKIEQIRKGAKADRRGGNRVDGDELSASLNQLQEDELLPGGSGVQPVSQPGEYRRAVPVDSPAR